jgi:hypothetical protein
MIEILHRYVQVLCSLRTVFQQLPAPASLTLELVAGGYVAPTGLALTLLVYWFEGPTAADRLANQRTALRGLVAVFVAWGVATLSGLAWELGLNDPGLEQAFSAWPCWQGLPSVSAAAALGFALGTTLWRRDWRWGLGIFVATGLWTGAQVGNGLCYPMDVVVGAVVGAGLAWLLGPAQWLNRPIDALVRVARRLMLA